MVDVIALAELPRNKKEILVFWSVPELSGQFRCPFLRSFVRPTTQGPPRLQPIIFLSKAVSPSQQGFI